MGFFIFTKGKNMKLIKICNGVYINPEHVAVVTSKVEFTSSDEEIKRLDGQMRSTTTTITSAHGSELAKIVTSVMCPNSNYMGGLGKSGVPRDNHVHAEILKAISEQRDATEFDYGLPDEPKTSL
jgi:hypothetical protein